jgi:hypothetical protein
VTLRPVIEEAQRIAQLTQLSISVEESTSLSPEPALSVINKLVLTEIISKYTMIDEELCDIIIKYFFSGQRCTKQVTVFRQRILDELHLIKKMELVHEIKDMPKSVRNAIHDLNAMRNAFTYSLCIEKCRLRKKHSKVSYRGKDIRTYQGLKMFMEDTHQAHMYLWRRSSHMMPSSGRHTKSRSLEFADVET